MKWLKHQIVVLSRFLLLSVVFWVAANDQAYADDWDAPGESALLGSFNDLSAVSSGVRAEDSISDQNVTSSTYPESSHDGQSGKAADLLGADGKPLSKSIESEKKVDCDNIKRQMMAVLTTKSLLLKFCESQNLKMKELGLRYCSKDSCFVSLVSQALDPIEIFFNAWSSDYQGNPGLMVGVKFSLDRSLTSPLSCINIGKETFTLDEIDAYHAYVRYLENKLECEPS